MKITIIGTGYVGLVSGVCLAAKGHNVICIDKSVSIVNKLNSGKPTIYEKDLESLLKLVIKKGKFTATNDFYGSLSEAEVIMIAVGTPSVKGKINLDDIIEVTRKIGNYIASTNRFVTVIVKSTVIPGTTDTIIKKEIERISGKSLSEFGLGMNPEFLREGSAINDFMFPDRIVLGFENSKTLKILEELYSPWSVDKIKVNSRTAELIKYANNIILATQISSINEIANFANKIGNININKVVKAIKLDKRWNPIIYKSRVNPDILKYLEPGCGFGGSCFAKDLQALINQGNQVGLPMKIMDAVLEVNKNQPFQVCKILESEFGELSGQNILILGLAFKPETDDVRESPALKIAKNLINKGAKIFAHDPVATKNFKNIFGIKSSKIKFVKKWSNYLKKVKIIIIVTPWKEYYSLINLKISNKVIFDTRSIFSEKYFTKSKYLTIGKII